MLEKYFITIVLVLYSFKLVAQGLQPMVSTIKHDKQNIACWVINADPEPKTLKKAWNTFLKDNYRFKLKGIGLFANKDLLQAEAVRVGVISKTPVNFFTHIVEDDSGSEMKVFVSDQQQYFSSNYQESQFNELADIMKSFLKSYLPQYHQSKINDTEIRISELNQETEDLEEEIAENLESIEEMENEIVEMRKQLESNRAKLVESRIKLEKRKAKLQRKRSTLQAL
jgi:hypothetical protein